LSLPVSSVPVLRGSAVVGCRRAYVYFNNDDEGRAVTNALQLRNLL
jgi:uncharacterized protein YecE (DUF72 family)